MRHSSLNLALNGLTSIFLSSFVLGNAAYAQGCALPPAGLVSWWAGDGDANDILGNNHGTIRNGASFATGMVDQGFSFNGQDGFVHIPNSASLAIAGAYSVEFWFSPNATINQIDWRAPVFISKGHLDSINLANNDGRVEVRGPEMSSPYLRPSSVTNTWLSESWYHIAVTFDTANYKIYVNGILEGGVPSTYSIMRNTNDVVLGSIPVFPPAIVAFNGLVDEMSLYERALEASEILAIVEAGAAGKCKPKEVLNVQIDIKPGSDENSINPKSSGVIPVAILSTSEFDATTIIPATVSLSGAKVKTTNKGSKYLCHEDDINGDGLLDMVCQVEMSNFTIGNDSTVAVLEAETIDGTQIYGEDSINIVP